MTLQVQQALPQVIVTDSPWPESEAACNLDQAVRKHEPPCDSLPDSKTLHPESLTEHPSPASSGPGTGCLTSWSFDFCFVLGIGFLCVALPVLDSLCISGWSRTHRYSHVSASQVPGLEACATTAPVTCLSYGLSVTCLFLMVSFPVYLFCATQHYTLSCVVKTLCKQH